MESSSSVAPFDSHKCFRLSTSFYDNKTKQRWNKLLNVSFKFVAIAWNLERMNFRTNHACPYICRFFNSLIVDKLSSESSPSIICQAGSFLQRSYFSFISSCLKFLSGNIIDSSVYQSVFDWLIFRLFHIEDKPPLLTKLYINSMIILNRFVS